jgi:F-type H+-transporting ATPase subunit b
MLIDWFTVCAQLINFLILVWLLKRFLYGRILRAIDTRERNIAERLADAEAKLAEARQQAVEYEDKVRNIEEQREAILAKARVESEQQHAAMLDKARRDVRGLEAKWQEELERDRHAFLLNLRRRAAIEILSIVRRVLADMTSSELEQCATQVFIRKIRSLDRAVWSRFTSRDMLVVSSLELSDDQRARILRSVEEQVGMPVHLRFETGEDIGLGLELRADGWRIAWNSETYLKSLEEDLNEAITETGGAAAMAAKTSK